MRLFFAVFLLSFFSANSQTFYSVDYKSQAKGNEGLWFLLIINLKLAGLLTRKNIYYI